MFTKTHGVTSERIIDLYEVPEVISKKVLYNRFVAEGMAKMHSVCMTPQEKMRYISQEWNKQKQY